MNKELIIHAEPPRVEIAILEDKELVELHNEVDEKDFKVGDFYVGKVRKINISLNGAFVDVGHLRDAFLHYTDLGPQIRTLKKFIQDIRNGKKVSVETYTLEPDTDKHGKITDIFDVNQEVLVQIVKEPWLNKGPTITTELSLPGRYVVLIPFSNKISVSQKILSPAERNRLKKIAASIQPPNFGVIIRTVAENKSLDEIKTDLDEVVKKWRELVEKIRHLKAPSKILGEIDRSLAIVRDLVNSSFSGIYIDDPAYFKKIYDYLSNTSPDLLNILKLYSGKQPIFQYFGVDKQIKTLLGKKVYIKSGAYLIIERTEALHVIDVNSGYKSDQKKNIEDIAIETNLEAAKEIARQLRLRDLGGIIVVDFIDMRKPENKKLLYQTLKQEMQKDRAIHTVLPPTKFGLVQITRQRMRPSTEIEVNEKCPVCDGTGVITNQIAFTDILENKIQFLRFEQNEKIIRLKVSPMLYAFLLRKFPFSLLVKWMIKYLIFIKIKQDPTYHLLEYHFFDKNNNEIII